MKKLLLALSISILTPILLPSLTGNIIMAAEDNVIWIDTRTQGEWDNGHLDNATLIPYDEISSKIAGLTTNKNQAINLYCRSGNRAGIAKRTLEKMGFTNVQNLGGYEDLKSRGN